MDCLPNSQTLISSELFYTMICSKLTTEKKPSVMTLRDHCGTFQEGLLQG